MKSQRQYIFSFLLILSLTFLFNCANFQSEPAPQGLMTDLLKNPKEAVITNPEPRFSWIVNGESDATMQTAYQILISSDKQIIKENEGDVWDSGKVSSEESVSIPFQGK